MVSVQTMDILFPKNKRNKTKIISIEYNIINQKINTSTIIKDKTDKSFWKKVTKNLIYKRIFSCVHQHL